MITQEKIVCWKEYSCVLTHGTDFRFFAIDTDSVKYASGKSKKVLKVGDDGTYKASTSLTDILSCFTWFMVAIKSITNLPRNDTHL